MKQTRKHRSHRSKLTLHRATVRVLNDGGLAHIAGGINSEVPECSSSITKPLTQCLQ